MKKKQKSNGTNPATQADLALWGGELTRRIDGLDGRMDGLETNMGQLQTNMEQLKDITQRTLDIVQEIDANRREERMLNLPTRVTQLEKDSGYLHSEVRKLKQRPA